MTVWEQVTNAVVHDFANPSDAGAAARVGLRLVLAAFLGGVLGFERESVGKSAGLRTHMLVALGSALFVLTPLEAGADDAATARVIQGLIAGIGFLGAGAIVKGRPNEEIQGLTTAAGIWMTAALGMTVALGHAWTAIAAAVVALIVLRVLPSGGPAPPSRPDKQPNAHAVPPPSNEPDS